MPYLGRSPPALLAISSPLTAMSTGQGSMGPMGAVPWWSRGRQRSWPVAWHPSRDRLKTVAEAHSCVPHMIRRYVDITNAHPKPFIWTKTADEILASVARFCQRISNSGH
jgi:hypothetical protein